MKRTALLALVLLSLIGLATAPLAAQTAPPVTHLVMAPAVARVLDSLANDAREHRIENAACVVAYAVRDSVLYLERLGPATYAAADSVTISVTNGAPICGSGVPSVHSHVAWGGTNPPSDTDRHTAAVRGIWNALLSVRENGWLLHVY